MGRKADFANTINTMGATANLSGNECERCGMTFGCDGGCSVFQRGECKLEDTIRGTKKLATISLICHFN